MRLEQLLDPLIEEEYVVKYLNNPDNQDQLGTGGKNDQPYSIQAQLKQLIK